MKEIRDKVEEIAKMVYAKGVTDAKPLTPRDRKEMSDYIASPKVATDKILSLITQEVIKGRIEQHNQISNYLGNAEGWQASWEFELKQLQEELKAVSNG